MIYKATVKQARHKETLYL